MQPPPLQPEATQVPITAPRPLKFPKKSIIAWFSPMSARGVKDAWLNAVLSTVKFYCRDSGFKMIERAAPQYLSHNKLPEIYAELPV